jgi:hypothetical protein
LGKDLAKKQKAEHLRTCSKSTHTKW